MTGSDVREKEGCEAFTPGAAEYVAQVVHPESIHVTPKRLVRFVLTAPVYTYRESQSEKESQLYTYIVNDVCFRVLLFGSFWVRRANQVDLVVLKFVISTIHVYYVVRVVYPESVFSINNININISIASRATIWLSGALVLYGIECMVSSVQFQWCIHIQLGREEEGEEEREREREREDEQEFGRVQRK